VKREAWESPATLLAAVIWLAILLWLGPRALDLEAESHPVHPAQLIGGR
jgi:hypothetical protein